MDENSVEEMREEEKSGGMGQGSGRTGREAVVEKERAFFCDGWRNEVEAIRTEGDEYTRRLRQRLSFPINKARSAWNCSTYI